MRQSIVADRAYGRMIEQYISRPHVSLGSNADLAALNCDFRYTPESGLKSDIGA